MALSEPDQWKSAQEILNWHIPNNYNELGFAEQLRSLDPLAEECSHLYEEAARLDTFRRGARLIDSVFPNLAPALPLHIQQCLGYLAFVHTPKEDVLGVFRMAIPEAVLYRLKVEISSDEAYQMNKDSTGLNRQDLNDVEGEISTAFIGKINNTNLPARTMLSLLVVTEEVPSSAIQYAVPAHSADFTIVDPRLDDMKKHGFVE